MDIEQLKLILETLQQLGAGSKDAFLWWLAFSIVGKILWPITWVITILVAARFASKTIRANAVMDAARKDLGYGYYSDEFYVKTAAVVHGLVDANVRREKEKGKE